MHALAQAWTSKGRLWKWEASSGRQTWQQIPLAAAPSRRLLCFSFLWKVRAVSPLLPKLMGHFLVPARSFCIFSHLYILEVLGEIFHVVNLYTIEYRGSELKLQRSKY